jgi:hypothetical protein
LERLEEAGYDPPKVENILREFCQDQGLESDLEEVSGDERGEVIDVPEFEERIKELKPTIRGRREGYTIYLLERS